MHITRRVPRSSFGKIGRGILAAALAVTICFPVMPTTANAVAPEQQPSNTESSNGGNVNVVDADKKTELLGGENRNDVGQDSPDVRNTENENATGLFNHPLAESNSENTNGNTKVDASNGVDSTGNEQNEVEPAVEAPEASLPFAYDDASATLHVNGADGIDWDAFADDANFDMWKSEAKTIVLSNLTLDTQTFRKFSALTRIEMIDVSIPDGVCPFYGTGSSNGASVSVKGGTIGRYAFFRFGNMTSIDFTGVTIPDKSYVFNQAGAVDGFSMTWSGGSMGAYAFGSSVNMTSARLSYCDVANRAFQSCSNLRTVMFDNVGNIGEYAFQKCGISGDFTLTGVKTTGNGAFSFNNEMTSIRIVGVESIGKHLVYKSNSLRFAVIEDCGEVGFRSFREAGALTDVEIHDTKTVGWTAFENCKALSHVKIENVGLVEGGAFEGCDAIESIEVPSDTKLGYIDAGRNLVDVLPGITDRVEQILRGKFALDSAPGIVELHADGEWDDVTVGKSDNWDSYDGGTQLVQKARWIDNLQMEASVEVDAYYTSEKQMDYIFVVDLSNSMTLIGNPADDNARFYDMQSKLLDVSSKLLDSEGYDCRVAFVTFGSSTSETLGFFDDAQDARNAIFGLTPYYESTNYGLGLMGAKALVKSQEVGRSTTVVMLSDGQPSGDDFDVDGSIGGSALQELGVPVFGVLQSVPENERDSAKLAMENVCSDGIVFEASDTAGFSNAVNNAIAAAYKEHVITIPVNGKFGNVRNIRVSEGAGNAVLSNDGKNIVWTVTGMPFTKHVLTYDMTLAEENTSIYGDYLVNDGDAFIADGATTASPVLVRSEPAPIVPVDPTPEPTPAPEPTPTPVPMPTPNPVPTPVPAPVATPTAPTVPWMTSVTQNGASAVDGARDSADDNTEVIEDESVPMASPEEIVNEPTPLASGARQCWVHWLMIAGIILTILYGIVVVGRRENYTFDLKRFERDVIENGNAAGE